MSEARPQRVMIPVEESFAEWRKDPKYVAVYSALKDEFARAAAKMRRSETSAGRRGAAG